MEALIALLAVAFLSIPILALVLAIVAVNRSRENAERLDVLRTACVVTVKFIHHALDSRARP